MRWLCSSARAQPPKKIQSFKDKLAFNAAADTSSKFRVVRKIENASGETKYRVTRDPAHFELGTVSGIIDWFNFSRFKVFIYVLPVVAVALVTRITLEATIEDFSGIFDSSSITPFATASMFVIAIILGGVLEDVRDLDVRERARALPSRGAGLRLHTH